jgi:hypothetical protein
VAFRANNSLSSAPTGTLPRLQLLRRGARPSRRRGRGHAAERGPQRRPKGGLPMLAQSIWGQRRALRYPPPTFLAKSSPSVRMVWRMTRSRSRPPPRGPLRISGESCDRPVALAIGLERLQGELGALGAPTPPWPVEAEGHRPIPLGAAFDDGADGHSSNAWGQQSPVADASTTRSGACVRAHPLPHRCRRRDLSLGLQPAVEHAQTPIPVGGRGGLPAGELVGDTPRCPRAAPPPARRLGQ